MGPGNYAARLCYNFELGSYDDWFLPSDEELNELYKQKNTVGGFVSDYYYWSSSEYDSDYAWGRDFNGYRYGSYKSFIRYVRATRAF